MAALGSVGSMRGKKREERLGGRGTARRRTHGRREHRRLLDLGRKSAEHVDARQLQQFAHLLEGEDDFAAPPGGACTMRGAMRSAMPQRSNSRTVWAPLGPVE